MGNVTSYRRKPRLGTARPGTNSASADWQHAAMADGAARQDRETVKQAAHQDNTLRGVVPLFEVNKAFIGRYVRAHYRRDFYERNHLFRFRIEPGDGERLTRGFSNEHWKVQEARSQCELADAFTIQQMLNAASRDWHSTKLSAR